MRVVVQRAARGQVSVDGHVVGQLHGPGLVLLVGITHTDTADTAELMADKVWGLRIFDAAEESGSERSAADLDAGLLVISQFTLYANLRKGRRPSWQAAAPRPISEPQVDAFVAALGRLGAHVETGIFGANMQVELVNDGPVTILLDSVELGWG
jgi:D-aminoacyl-tRNA deacylase